MESCAWGLHEVLADYTTSTGMRWEELSEEQQEAHRRSQALALKRLLADELTAAEAAENRACAEVLGPKRERKSNRDFLLKVDNMLQSALGFGLSSYLPKQIVGPLQPGAVRVFVQHPNPLTKQPQRRSVIKEPDGSRHFEVPRLLVGGRLVAPCLHWASDQGSVGLSASLFLLFGQKLRMTMSHDVLHRLANDLLEGITSSGLMLIRLEYVVVARMRRGPFDKQGFHGQLREAAADLAETLEVDNVLFELLYEDLVSESAELRRTPGIGTTEHMHKTLAWVKNQLLRRGCGENVVTSRWFSWEQGSRSSSSYRFVDLLLLTFIGQQKGWWKKMQECPLRARLAPAPAEQEEATAGAAEGAQQAAGAAPGAEGPIAARLSVAAGREQVRKSREKAGNTLRVVANLLAKDLNCMLWRAMCVLPSPLERFFSEVVTMVKSQRSVTHLVLGLSKGSLLEVVREQLTWVGSEGFAAVAGSPPTIASTITEHQQKQEQVLLSSMWSYTLHLCGALSLASMGFDMPPFSFLRLISPSAEEKRDALNYHKNAWQALEKAEELARDHSHCAELVSSALVGLQQFNREVFVLLLEAEWQEVPDLVHSMVSEFSRSWFSSLICEEGFNECRRIAGKSRTGRMEPASAYHAVAIGSTLLDSFDRKAVPITEAARAAASCGKVPTSVFGMGKLESTLGSGALDRLQSSAPDWPNLSPGSLRLAGAAWRCIVQSAGCVDTIARSFLSLLPTPGTLVAHNAHKRALLVLQSTPFGFLTWRAPAMRDRCVEFAPTSQSFQFHVVERPGDWRVLESCFQPLQEVGQRPQPCRGRLVVASAGQSLLAHACRSGFRQMTTHFMKRLLFEVLEPDWHGPRPSSEAQLVAALCKTVMGELATEEFVAEAMRTRHRLIGPACQ